jgi:hypothetical protein
VVLGSRLGWHIRSRSVSDSRSFCSVCPFRWGKSSSPLFHAVTLALLHLDGVARNKWLYFQGKGINGSSIIRES